VQVYKTGNGEVMDYYNVLGISREATTADVEKAYRKLAIQYHPDKNIGSGIDTTEKFKVIAEAFETLSDINKRARYNYKNPVVYHHNTKKQSEKAHDPNFSKPIQTGTPPTYDIWGQPLSPGERAEWVRMATQKWDMEQLLLNQKKQQDQRNQRDQKRWKKQWKKWQKWQKWQHSDQDGFIDMYANRYENGELPEIR